MTFCEELIGSTVEKLYVTPGEQVLYFVCKDKQVALSAEGDCCSSSYFNDINGIDALIGGKVLEIKEVDCPRAAIESDCELVQFYGIKIVTNKGYVDIVFRNESNGYYGGWCSSSEVEGNLSRNIEVTKDGDFASN